MTTLPPPATQNFPGDSLEKKVYNLIEGLKEYLPILNDRNRLAFNLYKYMRGEGDKPEILVRSAKVKVSGISLNELAAKINAELAKIS